MDDFGPLIGLVTRCSSRGFVGAMRLPETDLPVFGAFCKAEAQRGHSNVIGLIYDISIEDDEFARQMAIAEQLEPENIADQQARLLPVEISALSVGYLRGDQYLQTLPPQPPISMASIYSLSMEEVQAFTTKLDFISLILSASQMPVDDLLVAALRQAAQARSTDEQRSFLLEAGRECARLLARDLTRLEGVIFRLTERDDRFTTDS
ncbi:MAG TPA: hypothetical protein G4O14_08140 [Anaerolineae bacterium]|nr:hypothetical protein [Anaerolineae bacterium]